MVIFYFLGPQRAIFGVVESSKNVLGSTHVVEQLLVSTFPSILTFDFDLILGSFLTFRFLDFLLSSYFQIKRDASTIHNQPLKYFYILKYKK